MITTKTKYAIVALVRLAREFGKGPVLIRDIAEKENIPKKFLESILRDLKHAGVLNSKKGRSGGYYLNKNPEDINLAQIIRIFDGPIAYNTCVTHLYYEPCIMQKNETHCGIRTFFKEARDETVRIFKSANLAEIIKREERAKLK